jgi:hypothetical protein
MVTVKPWKKKITFCPTVKNCEKINEFEFSFLVLCKTPEEIFLITHFWQYGKNIEFNQYNGLRNKLGNKKYKPYILNHILNYIILTSIFFPIASNYYFFLCQTFFFNNLNFIKTLKNSKIIRFGYFTQLITDCINSSQTLEF